MKKNVLIIAGLAVLSTSAFASKARMEALGQGSVSYYVADTRDVFATPAALNDMKNYLITEWGTGTSTDSTAVPRAEGGFFRDAGAFSYGLYLGNNTSRFGAHTTNGTYLDQSNALDLFLAGDMGVKWGARVHYANGKDETGTAAKKQSAFGLGLGAIQGNFSGYLNLDLADKSTGDGTTAGVAYEDTLKPSFTLGASYAAAGYTFFAEYTGNKLENKEGTVTSTEKYTEMVVGAGRIHEISPTARIIADAAVHIEKATNYATSYDSAAQADTTKYNRLPITLGFEADATSWLVLRGSVSQNLILADYTNTAGKKVTKANSSTVNAGATLNFGKLKVDGVIGTTAASRAGSVGAGTNQGVLTTDNLMTRVGVSYWF